MRSGKATSRVKDISFAEALNDPVIRPEYIRRKWMQCSHYNATDIVRF
jgi:hypothetical protein